MVLANFFPDAELAKAIFFMEPDAGDILGKDPGLEGPEAIFLTFGDEGL